MAVSCEYSPYDTEIIESHPNSVEVADLYKMRIAANDTFKFAVLSDIHDSYNELSDAVKSINKQEGLLFVLCCGDLTNAGLNYQYEWYSDIIEKSAYPFISVIGNHDYRSNGHLIYEKIFGPSNYAFTAGNYKFVLFDNVIWENKNRLPRFDWLSSEMTDSVHEKIVVSHIPPWGDQISNKTKDDYDKIIDPSNTVLCLHGHTHNHLDTCYNGVRTIVSEAVNDREYYVISMIRKESSFKRIRF
jgi:predicted phosphodiesterase